MPRPRNGIITVIVLLAWITTACRMPMAVRSPPRGPSVAVLPRAADPAESERLIEQASLALLHLETGSIPEATLEIDELASLFPDNESAKLLETLLRRKLLRFTEAAAQFKSEEPKRNPDAANEKLFEARRSIKEGRDEPARLKLEAAYGLDPSNAEVTDGLVALLKKMGLELYSRGEAAQAVSHWQRVLEIRPGDAETLRFIQRANAVNRRM